MIVSTATSTEINSAIVVEKTEPEKEGGKRRFSGQTLWNIWCSNCVCVCLCVGLSCL